MTSDPESKDYKNDLMPFIERLKLIRLEHEEYVAKTPATLKDVEDAANYIINELRRIADFLDFKDYEFDKK